MAKKIGNQAPTRKVFINQRNSLFEEAVEHYEKTGRTAQKWQVNLLKPLLARTKDGLWVHTKFGYSLPRRNGKNEVIAMRELLGLVRGERILHTAHRTTTSHSAWERLLTLLDKAKIEYDSLRASGRERIDVEGGGRVEFRTRSSKGGLGEGFDLLIIDEAQEYTDDQESALKYVVTDSANPQTLMCGTPPTPLSAGTIFTNFRNSTLEGGVKNGGWAEWSVDDMTDPRDVSAWYKTNPSLGTVFTERSVEDEIGSDETDFNIQRLGLWLKYNQKSAISEVDWDGLQASSVPELEGPLHVGIKYGNDSTNVAMSIASRTKSGMIFVEAIDCQSLRNGNRWILEFLQTADVRSVVVDGANGQNILAEEMKVSGLKAPILPTVREIITANASFEQAIFNQTLCHMGQPSLRELAINSDKRNIGSNGGFGYASQLEDFDICLLDSALLAHWACSESKAPVKRRVMY